MHDAIVVGACCAGSATGMLLARRGYRVLVVDQASSPSDTVPSHWLHEPGVAKLSDWDFWTRSGQRAARRSGP